MSSPLSITYQGSTNTYEALSDKIISGLQKPTDWERSFGRRCVNMQLHVDFVSFEENLSAVKAERVVISPTPHATVFSPVPPVAAMPSRTKPVVLHLYFSDCQTVEGYKASRVREQITVWLSEIRSHHPCQEWAVIVLANTDTSTGGRLIGSSSRIPFKNAHSSALSSAGGGASQSSASSISYSSSTGGGKFEVADRIRADFCSRSLSDRHRCLVFRSPKSKNFQQDEFWWNSVSDLRAIIFDIVERKLRLYEDNVRRLREERQHSNFNILQCFSTQNHLASEYQQLGLLEDSLLQLDELDAMLTLFIEESCRKVTTDVLRRPCRDFNSPNLALFQHSSATASNAPMVHRQVRDYIQGVQDVLAYITANSSESDVLERYDINILRLRNHLFMRQCYLLIQLHRGWEIPLRAVALIHCVLHELCMLLGSNEAVAQDGAVITTKGQYLNALNAWSFLLALQCIEVADAEARNSSAVNMNNSARSEISFSNDDGTSPAGGGAAGPTFNSVRVQQANATLLDIARLKLRELGFQQKIAPVAHVPDFDASEQLGKNSPSLVKQRSETTTTTSSVIIDFDSILPVTFPHDGRQRLLRALLSTPAFTSYYLEFSEFVLGTCKHVGRIRGARLIGKELAAYYVTANEPEKATAFLRDAIKSCKFESWSQLAISSMSLFADCCYQSGNFERAVKDALLVACSSSAHHSMDTRTRFMRMAFHSANRQLEQQSTDDNAVAKKKSLASPLASSGPKTIKTTQIFGVQSTRRCNGEYPLFVSVQSSLYANDQGLSISEDFDTENAVVKNSDSPNEDSSALWAKPAAALPVTYSCIMLKMVVHSALPEAVAVDCSNVKCLLRHRPVGFRQKRSASSVVATDVLHQQAVVPGDGQQQHRQIPLLSSSSSHGSGSQKGSSLPRHYSAINFAQLAKQQNFEQQEVAATSEITSGFNKTRPDFSGEFAARRPGSAHVGGGASKAVAADDDDSAALAALAEGSSAVRAPRNKHLLQRLMTRPSVSGPDHFLALKQEQSGATNKYNNADSRRRKQSSALSRMASVTTAGASGGGGKLMTVKRVVTYGPATVATAPIKMTSSGSVSGPLSAGVGTFADVDGRIEHNTLISGTAGGPSSAKSTPTHRALAASALRKSANKASKLFSSSASSSALAASAVTGDSTSDDSAGRNVDLGGESDPLFIVAASSAPSDSLLGGESMPSSSYNVDTTKEEDAVSISRVSVASVGSGTAAVSAKPLMSALALPPGGRDSFRSRGAVTSAGLVCIPHESLTAVLAGGSPVHGGSGTWRAADSNAASPIHDLCVDALSLTPSRTESSSVLQSSSTMLERGNSIFSGNEVDADDDDDTTASDDDGEVNEVDGASAMPEKEHRGSLRRPRPNNLTARQHSIAESSQAASLYAISDVSAGVAADQQHFVVLKAAAACGIIGNKLTLKPGLNTLFFEGQLEEPGTYQPFALFIELVPRVVNIFSPIYADNEIAGSPSIVVSPSKTQQVEPRYTSSEIFVDNKLPQLAVLTDSGELYNAVPQTFSLKLFMSPHYFRSASQSGSVVAAAKDLDLNVRLLCRSVQPGNGGELSRALDEKMEVNRLSPLGEPVFLLKSYKERQNTCWAADSLRSDTDDLNNLSEKVVTLRAGRQYESEPIEALIPAYNTADDVELLVVVDYPWNYSKSSDVVQLRERSATEATLVDGSDGGGGDADTTLAANNKDFALTVFPTQRCQFVLARHRVRNTFNVETRQIATCKPDEHMLQVVLTCRYAVRFLLHNPMLTLLPPPDEAASGAVKIIGDAMGAQNFRSSWMPFKQGSRAVFTWRLASLPHEDSKPKPRTENNICKFLFSMDYGVDERQYGADAINKTTDINAFVQHLMTCKQDSNGHFAVSGRQSAASRNSATDGNALDKSKSSCAVPVSMPFRLQHVISANVQSRLVNVRICLRDQNKPLCRLGEQFFVKYRISVAFGTADSDSNGEKAVSKNESESSVCDLPLDLYYRVRLPPNEDSPDWKVLSGETGSLSLNGSTRTVQHLRRHAPTITGDSAHRLVAGSGDNTTINGHGKYQSDTISHQPHISLSEGDATNRSDDSSTAEVGSQTVQPILQPLRSGILQLPKLQLFMYRHAGLEELTSTLVYYENPCVLITVFVEEMPNNANELVVSDNDESDIRQGS